MGILIEGDIYRTVYYPLVPVPDFKLVESERSLYIHGFLDKSFYESCFD